MKLILYGNIAKTIPIFYVIAHFEDEDMYLLMYSKTQRPDSMDNLSVYSWLMDIYPKNKDTGFLGHLDAIFKELAILSQNNKED